MEDLHFNISINATQEKVWDALFSDSGYREWTSAFTEGSYAETDWKQGSKALFLDGKGNGMVAEIEVSRPYEFLSIKHLGELKNGVEDTTSEKVQEWAGAHENYTLTPNGNGGTDVHIDLESAIFPPQFVDFMKETWPRALNQLKTISER